MSTKKTLLEQFAALQEISNEIAALNAEIEAQRLASINQAQAAEKPKTDDEVMQMIKQRLGMIRETL